jgi:hypothetical protein
VASSVATERDRNARLEGLILLVSLVATAIVLASIAGLPLTPLRLPAGLVVGFFAPGYLLLRATVGDRMQSTMRLVLPVPLTLALAAITGVALDATPDGVRGEALGLVLCIASLLLGVVAVARGARPTGFGAGGGYSLQELVHGPGRPPPVRPESRRVPRFPLGIAVGLAPVAVGLRIARSIDDAPDTQAQVVLSGRVEEVMRIGRRAVTARVALSVTNNEQRVLRPLLTIAVDPATGASGAERMVPLRPAATRVVRLELRVPCGGTVRATLSGDGVPQRSVALRISCAEFERGQP